MVVAANARNCDEPVKTRTGWGNKAKETAADTEKPAKDLCDATFAANCARRASTKISWANKVKGIAVGIARLAEDANWDDGVSEKRLSDDLSAASKAIGGPSANTIPHCDPHLFPASVQTLQPSILGRLR